MATKSPSTDLGCLIVPTAESPAPSRAPGVVNPLLPLTPFVKAAGVVAVPGPLAVAAPPLENGAVLPAGLGDTLAALEAAAAAAFRLALSASRIKLLTLTPEEFAVRST